MYFSEDYAYSCDVGKNQGKKTVGSKSMVIFRDVIDVINIDTTGRQASEEKKSISHQTKGPVMEAQKPDLLYSEIDNGEVCLLKNFPFSGVMLLDFYRIGFRLVGWHYDHSYYFETQDATTGSEKQLSA